MTGRAAYLPECTASIRGTCLAESQGSTGCAVEDGECIYAAQTGLAGGDGPSVAECAAADRHWPPGSEGA